jgi:hypothetical protein
MKLLGVGSFVTTSLVEYLHANGRRMRIVDGLHQQVLIDSISLRSKGTMYFTLPSKS